MENLRTYYKNLTPSDRRQIAEAAGTTVDYLYQICRGDRQASHRLAPKLEQATGIPKSTWRPDIWTAA